MSYSSEVLADAPSGYWHMDEASGLPQDSSGNTNHSDASSGAATYRVTGAITSDAANYAISVGATMWFEVPDHATLDLGDVFTLEAWVKRDDTSAAEHNIFHKQTNAYQFFFTTDNKLAVAKAGVAIIASSSGAITDTTTWHHCVATKNGATTKIYLDGVDVTVAGTAATCTDTTLKLYLGSNANAQFLLGSEDEMAVYPTALSAERVLTHYMVGVALTATLPGIQSRVPMPMFRVPGKDTIMAMNIS